ncbi:tetratricopeptide repeat protein [Parasphingopyxis sp. CP4]|uniref:tetratricopeptide repeat protein n=1 Tax=Parasphingopyxis sp. CP4 TaxID=2724527 RepID=UPI0015A1EB86|nr:tetratricopeptide repeat protein [Parasphingopyxis sp. CP4]QLC22439.1 tetratricopeptide repeat protein [Parasphingopyxis sp. CP4]
MRLWAWAICVCALPASPAHACAFADLDFAEQAIAANRLIQAQEMLEAATTACSSEERYLALAAALRLQQGELADARSRFEALAVDNPENPQYASGAGRAAMRQGDNAAALDWLMRATMMPDADWQAWSSLGIVLDSRRHWAESTLAYEQALALAPEEPSAWNNRGYSLIMQRRAEEALPFLEAAQRLAPDDRRIGRNRLIAAAMLGNYPQYQLPAESARDWASRLNDAGYGAMLAGNYADAERLFDQAIEASDVYFARAARNRSLAQEAQ